MWINPSCSFIFEDPKKPQEADMSSKKKMKIPLLSNPQSINPEDIGDLKDEGVLPVSNEETTECVPLVQTDDSVAADDSVKQSEPESITVSDSQQGSQDSSRVAKQQSTILNVYSDLQKTSEELDNMNKNLLSFIDKIMKPSAVSVIKPEACTSIKPDDDDDNTKSSENFKRENFKSNKALQSPDIKHSISNILKCKVEGSVECLEPQTPLNLTESFFVGERNPSSNVAPAGKTVMNLCVDLKQSDESKSLGSIVPTNISENRAYVQNTCEPKSLSSVKTTFVPENPTYVQNTCELKNLSSIASTIVPKNTACVQNICEPKNLSNIKPTIVPENHTYVQNTCESIALNNIASTIIPENLAHVKNTCESKHLGSIVSTNVTENYACLQNTCKKFPESETENVHKKIYFGDSEDSGEELYFETFNKLLKTKLPSDESCRKEDVGQQYAQTDKYSQSLIQQQPYQTDCNQFQYNYQGKNMELPNVYEQPMQSNSYYNTDVNVSHHSGLGGYQSNSVIPITTHGEIICETYYDQSGAIIQQPANTHYHGSSNIVQRPAYVNPNLYTITPVDTHSNEGKNISSSDNFQSRKFTFNKEVKNQNARNKFSRKQMRKEMNTGQRGIPSETSNNSLCAKSKVAENPLEQKYSVSSFENDSLSKERQPVQKQCNYNEQKDTAETSKEKPIGWHSGKPGPSLENVPISKESPHTQKLNKSNAQIDTIDTSCEKPSSWHRSMSRYSKNPKGSLENQPRNDRKFSADHNKTDLDINPFSPFSPARGAFTNQGKLDHDKLDSKLLPELGKKNDLKKMKFLKSKEKRTDQQKDVESKDGSDNQVTSTSDFRGSKFSYKENLERINSSKRNTEKQTENFVEKLKLLKKKHSKEFSKESIPSKQSRTEIKLKSKHVKEKISISSNLSDNVPIKVSDKCQSTDQSVGVSMQTTAPESCFDIANYKHLIDISRVYTVKVTDLFWKEKSKMSIEQFEENISQLIKEKMSFHTGGHKIIKTTKRKRILSSDSNDSDDDNLSKPSENIRVTNSEPTAELIGSLNVNECLTPDVLSKQSVEDLKGQNSVTDKQAEDFHLDEDISKIDNKDQENKSLDTHQDNRDQSVSAIGSIVDSTASAQMEKNADPNRKLEVSEENILGVDKSASCDNVQKIVSSEEIVVNKDKELCFDNRQKTQCSDECITEENSLPFDNVKKSEKSEEIIVNEGSSLTFNNVQTSEKSEDIIVSDRKTISFDNIQKSEKSDENIVLEGNSSTFDNGQKSEKFEETIESDGKPLFDNIKKVENPEENIVGLIEEKSDNVPTEIIDTINNERETDDIQMVESTNYGTVQDEKTENKEKIADTILIPQAESTVVFDKNGRTVNSKTGEFENKELLERQNLFVNTQSSDSAPLESSGEMISTQTKDLINKSEEKSRTKSVADDSQMSPSKESCKKSAIYREKLNTYASCRIKLKDIFWKEKKQMTAEEIETQLPKLIRRKLSHYNKKQGIRELYKKSNNASETQNNECYKGKFKSIKHKKDKKKVVEEGKEMEADIKKSKKDKKKEKAASAFSNSDASQECKSSKTVILTPPKENSEDKHLCDNSGGVLMLPHDKKENQKKTELQDCSASTSSRKREDKSETHSKKKHNKKQKNVKNDEHHESSNLEKKEHSKKEKHKIFLSDSDSDPDINKTMSVEPSIKETAVNTRIDMSTNEIKREGICTPLEQTKEIGNSSLVENIFSKKQIIEDIETFSDSDSNHSNDFDASQIFHFLDKEEIINTENSGKSSSCTMEENFGNIAEKIAQDKDVTQNNMPDNVTRQRSSILNETNSGIIDILTFPDNREAKENVDNSIDCHKIVIPQTDEPPAFKDDSLHQANELVLENPVKSNIDCSTGTNLEDEQKHLASVSSTDVSLSNETSESDKLSAIEDDSRQEPKVSNVEVCVESTSDCSNALNLEAEQKHLGSVSSADATLSNETSKTDKFTPVKDDSRLEPKGSNPVKSSKDSGSQVSKYSTSPKGAHKDLAELDKKLEEIEKIVSIQRKKSKTQKTTFTCIYCQLTFCSDPEQGKANNNYSNRISAFCESCFQKIYREKFNNFMKNTQSQ